MTQDIPTPPSGPARSSKSSGLVWLSAFLFLGGIGLGVWVSTQWLVKSHRPDPRFEPNAQMATTVEDKFQAEPQKLKPLLFLGKKKRGPLTDAILLNGGGETSSNYFSHHLHIRMMRELLLKRGLSSNRIQIFSSDGENPRPDQVLTKSLPMSWLWRELPEWQLLDPMKRINTTLAGARMLPARQRYLNQGFSRLARKVKARKRSSTVLMFVTDHGTKGRGPWGNKIELWKQQLNVRSLRRMMEKLGSRTRVVSVMSQCYSGGFANLLYRPNWQVHGNRCGFFSTVANREAYGCFPETATKDRVGHAYRIIRSMRRANTYEEAHEKVLTSDLTPDVPISTSDIYLEDMMKRRFKRTRGSWVGGVDKWLKKVWSNPHSSLKKEIALLRSIEKTFYLPKYTSLRKVWRDIKVTRGVIQQVKQLDTVWSQVWKEVQQGTLMSFYRFNTDVARGVEYELNRPDIDALTRKMGRKLHSAYLAFLKTQPFLKKRLTRLHGRHERVTQKIHLLFTHEAALLRVGKRLTRIAGLEYLRRGNSRRHLRSLNNLLTCERTPIGAQKVKGVLKAEGNVQETGKPRKLKKIALASLFPSWLGIGFQAAPPGWNSRFEKMAPGAVLVNSLSMGSPAHKGGLQVGDIIVAVGGRMLKLDNEVRDMVMLSPAGKKAFFLVQRNNKMLTLRVLLQRLEQPIVASNRPPPHQGQPHTGQPRFEPDPNPGQPTPRDPGWEIELEPDTRVFGLKKKPRRKQGPRRRKSPTSSMKLKTIQGSNLTFPAQKGVSLAFFWATWCEGCKTLVPMLRRIQRNYQRRGLKIFAVTSDGPSMLRPFKQKWGSRFPFQIAIDKPGTLSRRFRISSIPQVILFKPDGSVLLHIRRFGEGSQRQIESLLRRHL